MMNRADRRKFAALKEKKKRDLKRKVNVGYRGQDYEVQCTFEDQAGYVVGWTDDPKGGSMLQLIELHPSMKDGTVIHLSEADKELRRKNIKQSS